jgi:putative mRNA 3-end processing factor
VVWRDGVHLSGTPIWCDARRRQDICFVSSVERVPRTGHGQLIATPMTLALLGGGDGHLGVPVRQRFTLGTVRLELIPSGRGLGAAALFADIAGRKVLYANTVRTVAGGSGDPAEVRTCDAVVVSAPFGEKHHVFPPLARIIDQTSEWAKAQLAANKRPVLFVDGLLDGLEVATALTAAGVAVSAHRAIRDAATRGKLASIASVGKEPRAVIWLDSDHAGLAKAMRDASGKSRVRDSATEPVTELAATTRATSFATALVSGRAIEGGAGYDAAFAWATAADRAQLLGWIEAANARQVFVTGTCAEAIAEAVGAHARVIGPPQQMALFAR